VCFQKLSIPPPRRVSGNSKGRGVLKAKIFNQKESKSLNWNFQKGGDFKPRKNPPWGGGGGMDIFWNNTIGKKCGGNTPRGN